MIELNIAATPKPINTKTIEDVNIEMGNCDAVLKIAGDADIEMGNGDAILKIDEDADIEMGTKKWRVLIIDDSSANRSADKNDLYYRIRVIEFR